jgi:hypothetical protein
MNPNTAAYDAWMANQEYHEQIAELSRELDEAAKEHPETSLRVLLSELMENQEYPFVGDKTSIMIDVLESMVPR